MVHSVLAVFFFKGTSSPRDGVINISGVDFWHAVEFSRNGSFLRDRFTGPSGLSLRSSSSLADPISRFRHPLEGLCRPAFAFRPFRLYQILSGLIFCQ
jgi:hypothetical protein